MSRSPALALLLLAACSVGGLTPAKLEAAKEKVHAMQPRDAAVSSLTAELVPATKSTDEGASWFAPDGDKCRELSVAFAGDVVGSIELKPSPCP